MPPGLAAGSVPCYDKNAMIVRCPACETELDAPESSCPVCLRGRTRGETTADDNLRTLQLAFAAYESAARGRVVKIK